MKSFRCMRMTAILDRAKFFNILDGNTKAEYLLLTRVVRGEYLDFDYGVWEKEESQNVYGIGKPIGKALALIRIHKSLACLDR